MNTRIIIIGSACLLLSLPSFAQNYHPGRRADINQKIHYCKEVIGADERDKKYFSNQIHSVTRIHHVHWKFKPYTEDELTAMGDKKATVRDLQNKIAARDKEENKMLDLISKYNAELHKLKS